MVFLGPLPISALFIEKDSGQCRHRLAFVQFGFPYPAKLIPDTGIGHFCPAGFETVISIHVENEIAAGIEMFGNAFETLLKISLAQKVIHAVELAGGQIEFF